MRESDRLLLRQALDLCQQQKQERILRCHTDCNDRRKYLAERIEQVQRDLRHRAETIIASQIAQGQLPKKTLLLKELKKPLAGYLQSLVKETAEWMQSRGRSGEVSIAESLSTLRAAAALPPATRQLHLDLAGLPGCAEIELPITENWEHLLKFGGAGLLSGFAAMGLAALLVPGGVAFAVGAAVSAIAGSLTDWMTDRTGTREDLVKECESFCRDRIAQLQGKLGIALDSFEDNLEKRCNSRMGSFIADLRGRLADLREPSDDELTLHRELDDQIARAITEFKATFTESASSSGS